jgi:hypothetical protein
VPNATDHERTTTPYVVDCAQSDPAREDPAAAATVMLCATVGYFLTRVVRRGARWRRRPALHPYTRCTTHGRPAPGWRRAEKP